MPLTICTINMLAVWFSNGSTLSVFAPDLKNNRLVAKHLNRNGPKITSWWLGVMKHSLPNTLKWVWLFKNILFSKVLELRGKLFSFYSFAVWVRYHLCGRFPFGTAVCAAEQCAGDATWFSQNSHSASKACGTASSRYWCLVQYSRLFGETFRRH